MPTTLAWYATSTTGVRSVPRPSGITRGITGVDLEPHPAHDHAVHNGPPAPRAFVPRLHNEPLAPRAFVPLLNNELPAPRSRHNLPSGSPNRRIHSKKVWQSRCHGSR